MSKHSSKYNHKVTIDEQKQIAKLHFKKRITQGHLAKEYGVSRRMINLYCKRYGKGKSPLVRRKHVDEAEVCRMHVQDLKSAQRIATELKSSQGHIGKILKKHGVQRKPTYAAQKYSETVPHYRLRLKIWEAKVLERDGLRCKWCKKENSFSNRLEAHHIIPVRWTTSSEQLFDLENGITLCRRCHMKIHYREHEFAEFFRELIKPKGCQNNKSREFRESPTLDTGTTGQS